MLSKRPVLRILVALFFLLMLFSSHIYCFAKFIGSRYGNNSSLYSQYYAEACNDVHLRGLTPKKHSSEHRSGEESLSTLCPISPAWESNARTFHIDRDVRNLAPTGCFYCTALLKKLSSLLSKTLLIVRWKVKHKRYRVRIKLLLYHGHKKSSIAL